MTAEQQSTDLDRLIITLEQANLAPEEAAWQIYNFLKAQYKSIGSPMARRLLQTYLHLPAHRPSQVHSCILSVALHIADTYADFRLPAFLQLWGYDRMLREEDRMRYTAKNGRQALSLHEKTERALQSYMLRHADEHPEKMSAHGILPMRLFLP